MPVIFSTSFPIHVKPDGTIELLDKVKQEVTKCGCSDLEAVSKTLDVSYEAVKDAARQLAGDGIIACDPAVSNCCVDSKELDDFIIRMRSLR